jgi:hypothetical protein
MTKSSCCSEINEGFAGEARAAARGCWPHCYLKNDVTNKHNFFDTYKYVSNNFEKEIKCT